MNDKIKVKQSNFIYIAVNKLNHPMTCGYKAQDLGYNKAAEISREAAAIDILHRLVKLFISKL